MASPVISKEPSSPGRTKQVTTSLLPERATVPPPASVMLNVSWAKVPCASTTRLLAKSETPAALASVLASIESFTVS